MIECTYKDFVIIRRRARVIQDVAALKLLKKYNKDSIQRHFIQTILHASWIDHSQTRRLWLGMRSKEILRKMLPTNISLTTNITMSTRTQYHKIIQKMTEPLLHAYRVMLEINIRATGRLHQQIQSTADINNHNIELYPTTTINIPHEKEVREPNIQEAPSPFDTINRIELEVLFTQTEHT
jgi:hypothetical protein